MSKQWLRVVTVVSLMSLVGAGYAQERSGSAQAQQPQAAQQSAVVAEPEAPRVTLQAEGQVSVLGLMKFSGLLRDRAGNARTGAVGLTFALYKDQQGGAPLWLEVHNAQLDEQGRYTVLLGSTKSEGLPLELFSSGEARWLGVQLNLPGEEEQARVLLVSVPYAMKAADAETLGGKPPSAFVLAEKPEGAAAGEAAKGEAGKEAVKEGPERQMVISGTVGKIAKFVGPNADDVGDSGITESGSNVGIGTASPANTLEVQSGGATAIAVLGPINPQFRAQDTTNAAVGKFQALDSDVFVGAESNHNLSLIVNNTSKAVLDTAGRMGIGTTSPANTLEVQSAGATAIAVLGPTNPQFRAQDTTNAAVGKFQALDSDVFVGAESNHKLSLIVNNTSKAVLDTAGNMGIGTSSPAEKLEVAGNVKITGGGNGIVFPDSTLQTSAAVGDITGVVASIGLTGGATSGTATLELSGGARARSINYLAGCDNCGVLVDADDQKTFFQNVCDAITINSVTCFSDAGSPIINIQRQVGVAAPANVLSDLTCSTTGAPGTIVGAQSILNTNDKLDFVMVTAGGTAKRVTVVIKATMN